MVSAKDNVNINVGYATLVSQIVSRFEDKSIQENVRVHSRAIVSRRSMNDGVCTVM